MPGDVNQSGVIDLTMLQDGKLTVAIDPSWAEAGVEVPGVFNDAVISLEHFLQPKDVLFAVSSNGLEQINFVQSLHQLTAVPTVLETSLAGATLLGMGDLNASGEDDIFVVAANGKDIWALNETGGSYTLESAKRCSTQGVIKDLKVVRFFGNGAPYFVASTGSGIEFFRVSGTSLPFAISETNGNSSLAVLNEGLAGAQRVAWLRDYGTGRRMSVIDSSFGIASSLDLGLGVRSMSSADYNRDDLDDLVLTRVWGKKLRVHLNDQGVFHLNGPLTNLVTVSSASVGADSVPYIGDFDFDLDIDLAMVNPAKGALFMGFSEQVARSVNAPEILVSDEYEEEEEEHLWMDRASGTSSGFFENLTVRFVRKPTAPAAATAIEVYLWRGERQGLTNSYETLPLAVDRQVIQLSSDPIDPPAGSVAPSYDQVTMQAFDQSNVDDTVVFMTARYVAFHSGGTSVRQAWPVTQSFIVTGGNDHGLSYISNDIPMAVGPFIMPYDDPFHPMIDWGGQAPPPDDCKSDGPCCPDFQAGCPPKTD